jgi:hypothetical protein
MVTEDDVRQKVEDLQGSGKSYAEFLGTVFRDKLVEIYLGDSYEEVKTEQVSVSYPAVICGKVIAAYKECLVISCAYTEPSFVGPKGNVKKDFKLGKLVFISERAIRAMNEIDGKGVLEDLLLRSKESLAIRKMFNG